MRPITTTLCAIVLCLSLSGCLFVAAAGAGAGAGYIYKDQQEEGKI